jgi:hypothetical protein
MGGDRCTVGVHACSAWEKNNGIAETTTAVLLSSCSLAMVETNFKIAANQRYVYILYF